MEPRSSRVAAAIEAAMRAAIWISPILLSAGLAVWLVAPDNRTAAELLRVGLFSLMAVPMLRVVGSVARALGARDWLFLAATIAVLVELAITFTSASFK